MRLNLSACHWGPGFVFSFLVVGACAKVDGPGVGGEGGNTIPINKPDVASSTGGATVSDAGPDLPQGTPGKPCIGLECQTVTCPGTATSISGTVYAPNGKLPLYNVTVYIPNAPLDPLPVGVSCDRCGVVTSGRPIVAALSNSQGRFMLNNVPSGTNIPLVMQVGRGQGDHLLQGSVNL